MPRQPTGHLYNIPKLHVWFLVGNVLLLAAILGLIAQDHDREWKHTQREFQAIQQERMQVQLAEERQTRDSAALEQARADLAAAESAFAEHHSAYEAALADLEVLQGEEYTRTQDLKFAKAALAVRKYNFELAENGDPDHELAEAKRLFEETEARIATLTLEYEAFEQKLRAAEANVEEFTAARDEASKTIARLEDTENRILARLQRFDDTYGPNALRDAPMLDFMDPRVKIKQILLPDFVDDLNMDTTMKIDRCTTCHLSIDNPGYTEEKQPFRTHPNPDLYIASKSPHPIETFGCTVCHSGRGRGTTFVRAAHWPNDPESEERWHHDHEWHELHHWDFDQLPLRYVESSCYQCHQGQTQIDGAPKWNRGVRLMQLTGCFGCHKVEGFERMRQAGPSLRGLPTKTTPDWAYKWIRDPKNFRPNTRMPQFFDLPNINDEHNRNLSTAGINGIVAYLWATGGGKDAAPLPVAGDPAHGEQLLFSVGCMGCHQIGPPEVTDRSHERNLGPNLANLGSKLNERWLFAWLKNPHDYFPDTWMPNLRLSDQEAADLTAYLMQFRDAAFDAQPRLDSAPEAREELVLEFLKRSLEDAPARAKLASMSIEEQNIYIGEHVIRRNGCFGCHDIAGFEHEQRIGTELTFEGSKDVNKFDFGLTPSHPDGGHTKHRYTRDYTQSTADTADAKFFVPRTNHDWIKTKLLHPRIWDRGRVKKYDEYLKMPWFNFTEDEAESVVTVILSFQRSLVPGRRKYQMSGERLAVAHGRALVQEFNCRACHIIEGRGRAIASTIEETPFLPPDLTGEGKKVQTQWLFDFLIKPIPIRPWLRARMPTFGFEGHEANAIVEYFARLDKEPFPSVYYDPESISTASLDAGKQMFTLFQCQQCHVLGEIPENVGVDSLAPNLLMARQRLKPDWVTEWILAPEAFQPGTKMPGFFPDGREEESNYDGWFDADAELQAQALRDHIFVGLHGGNIASNVASTGAGAAE